MNHEFVAGERVIINTKCTINRYIGHYAIIHDIGEDFCRIIIIEHSNPNAKVDPATSELIRSKSFVSLWLKSISPIIFNNRIAAKFLLKW
jgi:hypothetical protein